MIQFSNISNKKDIIEKKKNLCEKIKEDIQRKKEEKRQLTEYFQRMIGYVPKTEIASVIPLHFYTCWHTKNLPPIMKENYENMRKWNNELEFHLYDENDCMEFIKSNFNDDVLNAYKSLIPCSYKSDLWRYCVLYINGGIYMDIKFICVNGFKLIELTDKEYFVKDRPNDCTYTALIVCKPGNNIFLKCIEKIVKNVKMKYYGETALDPTGPGLLGQFTKNLFPSMELKFANTTIPNRIDKYYMTYKNKIVLTYYDGYRDEQKKHQKNKYYTDLWRERNIYNSK
jgi:mannosyltransferase OCH1-like enzyme